MVCSRVTARGGGRGRCNQTPFGHVSCGNSIKTNAKLGTGSQQLLPRAVREVFNENYSGTYKRFGNRFTIQSFRALSRVLDKIY